MRRIAALSASLIAASAAMAGADSPLNDQRRLVAALRASGELHADRALAHASHTCDLIIDGQRYPVVDVRELVRGVATPRGVNRIVVLSPSLHAVRRIEYVQERPLLCQANRLYLFGAVSIDGRGPEGNVLVFADRGQRVGVETVEVNDWPIYPLPERR
jgi:hypothetical protein